MAEQVLARLAAGRSAWNAADIRGEIEQLIAAAGVVADAAVRAELAEDLTARAVNRCVPLLTRAVDAVPKHVRALTSQLVLDVEADLTGRLAARANVGRHVVPQPEGHLTVASRLDASQRVIVSALTGDWRLLVVEGAAGAGKTTTLAAARAVLDRQGHGLIVVTPTLKAAKVAAAEVGAAAGSAAWLAFQHGWRWDADGVWTRLAVGETDAVTGRAYSGPAEKAQLEAGDLLVIDETGMLDQDTARALLTVADECQVRVALIGDRHQLAAVGRGGVLDLAAGQVEPAAHLTLAGVRRFIRTDRTGRAAPDLEYADLTLDMRTGEDPGAVFDALAARDQIQLHHDGAALQASLAKAAVASFRGGEAVAVVADTREQTASLNAAIRDQLVADQLVDDSRVVTTLAGQRIGAGDRIATRRNDPDLEVANRDTWTVIAVDQRGGLSVTPAHVTPPTVAVHGDVTPAVARERALPADYVARYVELGYASTAHGVQGDTVSNAHVVVGEHTGAAAAYVGMTRGRWSNTAHLIAEDLTDAREQWITVFTRDRADLGPAHAGRLAAAEAARYARQRSVERAPTEVGGGIRPPAPETYRAPRCAAGAHVRR
jgi:ATP-dependent exoDNAse (exonuclease V) alpha subunit